MQALGAEVAEYVTDAAFALPSYGRGELACSRLRVGSPHAVLGEGSFEPSW